MFVVAYRTFVDGQAILPTAISDLSNITTRKNIASYACISQ
jgi:hypothetical protein